MQDDIKNVIVDAINRLQDRVALMHDDNQEQLTAVNATLAKQEQNLQMHMYRTELAEKRLELLETDIKPLKTHIAVVKAGFQAVGVIAAVVGFLAGILQILEHFIK